MARAAKLLIDSIVIGLLVGAVYFIFEHAVAKSLDFFWDDLLDTDNDRLLIFPIILVMSGFFFYTKHRFLMSGKKEIDPEKHPTESMLGIVLVVGFFSLSAGVSLGPEAVLIPACLIVGSFVAKKLGSKDITTYAYIGFIALFAAFFSSVIAGVLGIYLAMQKTTLKPLEIIGGLVASVATVIFLNIFEKDNFFNFPEHEWEITLPAVLGILALLGFGFLTVKLLAVLRSYLGKAFRRERKLVWYKQAFIASAGLAVLYLAGGTLVQFTGNESIIPLVSDSSYTLLGLVWLFIIKVLAIAWSREAGYMGGMIFPMVFVATIVVTITQEFATSLTLIVGIVAFMVGAMHANRKDHTLF